MSMNANVREFFVRPFDVLLFRDGRPFNVGADHLATGLFPPLPTSFYGAFRSTLLSGANARFARRTIANFDSLPEVVRAAVFEDPDEDDPSRLGTLTLTHFSLAYYEDDELVPLYPLPLDLLRYSPKGKDEHAPQFLRARPRDFPAPTGVQTSLPIGLLPVLPHHAEKQYFEHREGLLDPDGLNRYLLGEAPAPAVHPHPEPGSRETDEGELGPRFTGQHPRTSVALGSRNTAEEGMLFAVEFSAFRRDVGFALRLEHVPELPERGVLKLGGESRMASFEATDVPALTPPDGLKEKIRADRKLTIVLFTPAPFRAGWCPDFVRDDFTGTLGGCTMRLVGAAVGRPVTVGGWDIKNNQPKLARPAAPAGSVYFFELTDDAQDVEGLFDPSSFGQSVLTGDDAKQGLGIAVIGAWPQDPPEATP